ncbi:MAG: aldehyde dehydrogenase family protein [Deltaproteobacteria bacterium]|jgi:succinate-semialdehyde dehydrogenase|nr:aldehyde dehydrogenase family protein [Deltaproteobacteria bacterium]
MSVQEQIDTMIERSRAALKVLATYDQEKIDALCKACCMSYREHAIEMSKEVIEETRLGNYDHKIMKNMGTPDGLWLEIKGKKSVGIIEDDPKTGLMKVAHPKGLVVVVAPTTNPNMTALVNSVLSIKGRNTVIICSHPRAKKTTVNTVKIMSDAMEALGAPKYIIQAIEEPSVELTQKMMSLADIIIATGGMAMVKAAYSSGKPAYGVGSGNVQSIVDRDFDLKAAIGMIVMGRSFDNGQVCACNQSAIVPEEKLPEVIQLLKENGAAYFDDPADIDKIRQTVFKNGVHNSAVVGQFPKTIADLAGVKVDEKASIIAVLGDPNKVGANELLCGEKMCPVLIVIPYKTYDQALEIAKANLLYSGAGHSCCVYSNTQENINKVGLTMPVCRVLVNQPGMGAANAFGNNALCSTSTLGCGTYGNNSLDENLNYRHMINVTQVAKVNPSFVPVPEDQVYK